MNVISATSYPPFGRRKSTSVAVLLLCVYMFMLYSRVFEATMLMGVPNIYLMLALSAAALLAVVFKGGVVKAARTPCGMLLVLFTIWATFILPFSSWKSESLHELSDVWLKSAAAFFIIVGLTSNFSDSKRVFAAVGYGAAVSTLLLKTTTRYYGDRVTSFGSLGNANEVAFHIAFGLPFLVLLMTRVKVIYKIALGAVALLSLSLSAGTASRAGLIIIAAIAGVAVLKVSPANKFKILGVALLAVAIGLSVVDKNQLERYKTMFSASDSSAEALSAQESATERKHKLQQSFELTLQHPIFGVGMGAFIPTAAEMSKQRGEHADWLASHNSYTQVSSETGVPGFLLIVSVFLVTLRALFKLHRKARRLHLKEVRSMALCMLLSCIALTIHFFFDAIAYQFYLPVVAGLATALVSTSRPLIEEAEASSRKKDLNLETHPEFTPPAGKFSTEIVSGNTYRLGRSRITNLK